MSLTDFVNHENDGTISLTSLLTPKITRMADMYDRIMSGELFVEYPLLSEWALRDIRKRMGIAMEAQGEYGVWRVLVVDRKGLTAFYLPSLIVAKDRQEATMKLGKEADLEPYLDYRLESILRFDSWSE